MVERAIAAWGRIDIVVNNAGVDDDCPFLDVQAANWQRVLGVNLTGPFLVSQRAARAMVAAGVGGAFVHIASIAALAGDGEQVAYGASKAGLLGLNRIMALELARHGIRSNVVHPGYTATPLTRQYVGEEMYEYMMGGFARIPQGRMALTGGDRRRRRVPRLGRRRHPSRAPTWSSTAGRWPMPTSWRRSRSEDHGDRLPRPARSRVSSGEPRAATRTTSSSRCTPTRASAASARPISMPGSRVPASKLRAPTRWISGWRRR